MSRDGEQKECWPQPPGLAGMEEEVTMRFEGVWMGEGSGERLGRARGQRILPFSS